MTVRRLAAKDCSQSCGLTSKGLSLCLFELNFRIRRRTLRTETLDWYAARDSERVVRTYQEVNVSPVSPSSTTKEVSNHNPCHLLRTQKLTYLLIHTYVNFTIHILFLSTLHIIFEKRRLL